MGANGAIDPETGATRVIEAESINAASTIPLLQGLEALYPTMTCIHAAMSLRRDRSGRVNVVS